MFAKSIIRTAAIFIILFCSVNVYASGETTKAGTSAAQFLKIGVGARAQALGGAFAAVSHDASSIYWNPAGIASIDEITWSGSHTQWFAEITHQFTAIVVPISRSAALGFSATLLTMDEEEITTIDQPSGTGLFWDASDLAIGVSYATQLTDRFSIGLTGKYISQKIFNESASTYALDVGTMLDTGFHGVVIGMSFTNFGGDLQLEGRDLIRAYDPNPANSRNDDVDSRLHTEPWPLPVNFKVGLALDLVGNEADNFFQMKNHRLMLAMDANHPNDAAENLRFGLEYTLYDMISFRGGYMTNDDLAQFTFGAGLDVDVNRKSFRIDYALASYGELENVNYISFGFGF